MRLLPLLLLFACRANAPVELEDALPTAVKAAQHHRSARAASAGWSFVARTNPDDPRYDRALIIVADSLRDLGLDYAAATLYRDVAHARRNLQLVPGALDGMEQIVAKGVYDEDSLITGFLASEEFGFLPPQQQAFVDYYRGLDLTRRGEDAWAEAQLGRIPASSPYTARASYLLAVREIADGHDDDAIEALDSLKHQPELPLALGLEIERTLARLDFERQHYDDALEHFLALREQAPNDPEILLELAWTTFYLGDARTTLGLLVALDAPIHRTYMAPERYLLEALALRRLCQFGAARDAAVRLMERHGQVFTALAAGTPPIQIPALRAAARLRGRARPNSKWMDRLQREQARAHQLRLTPSLVSWLDARYQPALTEAQRREDALLPHEIEVLGGELLASKEGVRLIVHELGVALLRGRRRPPGVAEKPSEPIPITGDRVFFPFVGEYWTDELDDLIVIAEDRCID